MSAVVALNAFRGVMIGLFAGFVAIVVALGAWSPRSAAEYLDWKPVHADGAAAAPEDDEAEQLLAAQNALRRRRGMPERTRDDVDADLRRARAELDARAAADDTGARGAWHGS